MQLSFQILNLLFVQNLDFQTKLNDFFNVSILYIPKSFVLKDFNIFLRIIIFSTQFIYLFNSIIKLWNANCGGDNDEWNPVFYAHYIRAHPEKFSNEGIREQLNIIPGGGSGGASLSASNDNQINTYYGNVILRCVPILEFLNNRYIEFGTHSPEAESLLDNLNVLFKFHTNPISYVYNSLMYYDAKFSSSTANPADLALNRSKKRRLFNILACMYYNFKFLLNNSL